MEISSRSRIHSRNLLEKVNASQLPKKLMSCLRRMWPRSKTLIGMAIASRMVVATFLKSMPKTSKRLRSTMTCRPSRLDCWELKEWSWWTQILWLIKLHSGKVRLSMTHKVTVLRFVESILIAKDSLIVRRFCSFIVLEHLLNILWTSRTESKNTQESKICKTLWRKTF